MVHTVLPLAPAASRRRKGEKEIAVVAGVSDNTYGIDVARGTLSGSDSEISLPAQTSSDRGRFRASAAAAMPGTSVRARGRCSSTVLNSPSTVLTQIGFHFFQPSRVCSSVSMTSNATTLRANVLIETAAAGFHSVRNATIGSTLDT
jgi:hypothetical protein